MKTPPLALAVMSGASQGQTVLLDRPVLLGRDEKSRVRFDDARISRHHALIEPMGDRVLVRDLGSKNGTFLNGLEIKEPCPLRLSDRVRIGKTTMIVVPATDDPHPHPMGGPTDTAADPHTDEPISGEAMKLNRRILRLAAEITKRVHALGRTRYPLPAVVALIRKEFQADGAGLFACTEPFEPLFIEGDLLPGGALRQGLELLLHGDPPKTAVFLPVNPGREDQTTMIFPVRIKDDGVRLFVLRRAPSRPFDLDQLQLADTLSECLRMVAMERIVSAGTPSMLPDHLGIVGSSEPMQAIRAQIRQYAAPNSTVLIVGESGTGKELCARALVQLSPRRFGPYVEVNAACMSPELIEAELFGHEKGAYTGATDRRLGKLEVADGGTLFLDEIGELPLELQAKFLRVLEGQPFYRLGGTELVHTQVRFLCATNRSLEAMVAAGTFRADLFHRINILRIGLPPLRDHIEDIPELVPYLIRQIQEDMSSPQEYQVTPKAFRRLFSYNWPGNVRELRNTLERIILLANSNVIDDKSIPAEIIQRTESTTIKIPRLQVLTEAIEREEIARVLVECGGHKSQAAKLLGISRPTLDKKIKAYALQNLASSRGKGEEDDDHDEEEGDA